MPPRDRRALVVFARVPELGRVKTRLAAAIGAPAALAAYRELAARTFAAAAAAAQAGMVSEVIVAFTPDDGGEQIAAWLGDGAIRGVAQGGGDLGARMRAAIEGRVAEGAGRVVVIGTDCPELDAAAIATAFDALDRADAVFGPALDGGYYLVGVRSPSAAALTALFAGVPWSAPDTLAVTLARARAAGVAVACLAPLADVDTADDWHRWQATRAAGGHQPAGGAGLGGRSGR